MKILVLNCGSSSLKAQLREISPGSMTFPATPLWNAHADWGRRAGTAELRIAKAGGPPQQRSTPIHAPAEVLAPVLDSLWSGPTQVLGDKREIDVIGHRIVHGGRSFRETTRVTPGVRAEIMRLAEFAPEHNRLEAEAIQAAQRVLGPAVPQIAVFDTAFHATLSEAAFVYPGPYAWLEQGVRRYGFHGISHQYASRRAAEIVNRPLAGLHMITCHLGNGCSLAAVRGGRSVDTTMGFTPLDGLMMGARSGAIDPGIIIYLLRHSGYSADQLDRILNEESGLMGVSGLSGDMRVIVDAMGQGNHRARLAFDVFIHILCRNIGAMAASLDRLDVLVFTAGMGENSAIVRQRGCERFARLGLHLDQRKNESRPIDADISSAESRTRVVVVRTEEEWEIARECYRVITQGAKDA